MIEHKIQTPLQYGVFLACDDYCRYTLKDDLVIKSSKNN